MAESLKHHFVPQVYLRYFAKERERKKGEYFLYVFDKTQDKTFPRNIDEIGYEKNFNRVHEGRFLPPVPDNNELHYEKKFQELIENDWNSIVHQFTATCTLSTQKKVLSDDMKFMLAKLIMIQSLRTPVARGITRSIGPKSCKKVFDELTPIIRDLPRDDLKKAFRKMKREFSFKEDQVKSFHLLVTTDNDRIERMAHILVRNRVWVVYRSPNVKYFPFITSDNPVVFYNPILDKYGIGPNGINVTTTVIGFPITPQYYIYSFHKKSPLGDFSCTVGDECIDVDPDIIGIIDRHQTNQCYRQVYLPQEIGEEMMNEEKSRIHRT